MARNQTLLKILTDMRGEARLSLNPAHNIADREAQIGLIQREQERLWADHDWPHLVVNRYIPLVEGQRYYDPRAAYDETWAPRTDLSMERLIHVSVFSGPHWGTLPAQTWEIGRYANPQMHGIAAWQRAEDDLLEIYPIPTASAVAPEHQIETPDLRGVLRLRGVRDLRRLSDDDDRADLDDRLLTLYAAAAILAEAGAKDTNLKLEAAQRHYNRLKADLSDGASFSLFGANRRCWRRLGDPPLPPSYFVPDITVP